MQTTVVTDPAVAFEGMKADSGHTEIQSYIAKSTNGAIKPGRAVTRGAADNTVVLPDATGEISDVKDFRGFTMYVASKELDEDGAYADATMIPVMTKGRIWMLAEDAIAVVTDAVFVRFAATPPEELGRVRHDADTADAVAAPGCRYLTTTADVNQLVLVEINIP